MKSNARGKRPPVQRVIAAMPVGFPASPRPPPPPPPPPPRPPPRCGSGSVARSTPNSFAFICTYESNAAADSPPKPPPARLRPRRERRRVGAERLERLHEFPRRVRVDADPHRGNLDIAV